MPSKVIPDMNRKVVEGRNQTFLNVFKGEKNSVWGKLIYSYNAMTACPMYVHIIIYNY